MIIQTDEKGRSAIEQLCDIALKQGGVLNLNAVNLILASISPAVQKEQPQPKSNPVTSKKIVEPKVKKVEKQKEGKKSTKKK